MIRQTRPALAFARVWQGIGWLLTAVVVIVTLAPKLPPLPGLLSWDKADHLLAYAGLMLWYRQAFAPRGRWVIFLIALGVVLEFIQGWSGYRVFEYHDMLANSLGVGCGLALALTPLGRVVAWLDRWLAARLRPTTAGG